jgi:DNA-binding SARP family transcriptional activator
VSLLGWDGYLGGAVAAGDRYAADRYLTAGDVAGAETVAELARLLRQLRRREARRRGGPELTYRELAARTGWSYGVIGQYFTGKVLAPTDRFDVLVRLLGAAPAEQGALASARDRVDERRRAGPVAADGPPPVEIRTLGGLQVLRHGQPVPVDEWQPREARDLLRVLLARRGRWTARNLLAAVLWPGEAPGEADHRLSAVLSAVRSVLDPRRRYPPNHFLRTEKDAVRIGEVPVDVETFLTTARDGLSRDRAGDTAGAAALLQVAEAGYTGDFLDDGPGEDWAAELREEAHAAYAAVTRALVRIATSTGDADSAVRYLLRILGRDPYDEDAHLRLVGILVRQRRYGEARRRHRLYVARMAELGLQAAASISWDGLART